VTGKTLKTCNLFGELDECGQFVVDVLSEVRVLFGEILQEFGELGGGQLAAYVRIFNLGLKKREIIFLI